MKPFSIRVSGLLLGLLAIAHGAWAQVLRTEITSPINESAIQYQPGGVQARASASVIPAGGIASLAITAAGAGYTTAPTVTFSGGGGSGAVALATISGGAVTGLTVTNPGSGYISAPTISLAGGGGAGASATATLTTGGVTGFTMLATGAGYAGSPPVSLVGGGGVGATATATVSNGLVTGITVTNAGTGYVSSPSVTIAPPPGGVLLTARITGTGAVTYTTQFFVNGVAVSPPVAHDVTTLVSAAWTPPQPGAYFLTAKTVDSLSNAFTTPAVRFFVTGVKVFSPIARTALPLGSSIVMSADGEVGSSAVNPFTGQSVFTPGFIRQIDFDVFDGSNARVFTGTASTYPYSARFTPPALGFYKIVATATDNNGQTFSSSDLVDIQVVRAIGTPPYCRIVNPVDGGSVAAGTPVEIIADAGWSATDASPGRIAKVEFYRDGLLIGTSQAFPFTATWQPTTPGRYTLVALAFDDKGNVITSSPATINVTGGMPSVQVTSPSGSGTRVVQGAKLTVVLDAAGADGGVESLESVEFLVDGNVSDSWPKVDPVSGKKMPLPQPIKFEWRSNVSLGGHRLAARVKDRNGLTITAAGVPVTVVANQLPQATITAPAAGGSSAVGASVMIEATAVDADGSIEAVEFFANGLSLGAPVAKAPFRLTWTPAATGSYVLIAKATDDAGGVADSAPVSIAVETAPKEGAGSGPTISVFRGDYSSPGESGRFALAVNRNGRGTFIGYSTSPAGRMHHWSDFAINADGAFVVRDSAGAVALRGQTSATGVSGTFGDRMFIGPITLGSASATPLLFNGALEGVAGGTVTVIVGADASVTILALSGSAREAGGDFLTATGTYAIGTTGGGRIAGAVVAGTGVASGTVSGSLNGTFLLRQQPGRLVNLSARAASGTGERTLVVGFGLQGTGAAPLLIRAIGPTLANFGVTGVLADPSLAIVTGGRGSVAVNDNWVGTPTFDAATARAGAFPLAAGSRDAALAASLDAGIYSAVVGGGGFVPANVLVEVYDTDASLSPQARLYNMSARSHVAASETLTVGFVIAGDKKKTLLIRAVGPTLAGYGLTGALADPRLDVFSGTTSIAGNNDWDAATVGPMSQAVGAFQLSSLKDAALVVQLNPGAYTAQVSGVGGTSGVVLVELYDADQVK